MPNWCDNSVTITADKEKIDVIENALKTKEQDFFAAIRPRPLSEEDNWYSWNVENWGTKWSPSIVDYEREDDTTIWITFESAWAPPIALYEFMHDEGYTVSALYSECGMCFIGKFEHGQDDCYEYDLTDLESIESIPEDLVDYGNLIEMHESFIEENRDEV